MYQIPLKFIKCGEDIAICATRIVGIVTVNSNQARSSIRAERKSGTLLNAAGNRKAKCAIFLDNGTVVASPFTVNRILSSINKANHKDLDGKNDPYHTSNIKVAYYSPENDFDEDELIDEDEIEYIADDEPIDDDDDLIGIDIDDEESEEEYIDEQQLS